MAKERKAGLHKKVSSIFDGVSVSKDGSGDSKKNQSPPSPREKSLPSRRSSSVYSDREKGAGKAGGFFSQLQKKLLTAPPGTSPTKHKLTIMVLPILAVVFIFIISGMFTSAPSAKPKEKIDKTPAPSGEISKVTPKVEKTLVVESRPIDWQIPKPYTSQLRDPMYIEPEKEPEIIEIIEETIFVVKSILQGPAGRSSVIGVKRSQTSEATGVKIVHEGETFLGATVIKINPDSVVFEENGNQWTVRKR